MDAALCLCRISCSDRTAAEAAAKTSARNRESFLLFFATVMLSAWYGGMGAGVAATILSALASDYFFLSPTYSLLKNNLGQNVRLVLFMLEGLSITWVIAQLHALSYEPNSINIGYRKVKPEPGV